MRTLLWVLSPVVLVAILRPWTLRPIAGDKPAVFDAAGFVSAAWPRLVDDATRTAIDVSELVLAADASPPVARFVKGTGVVTAVDRRSRVGVILVRVKGGTPVAIAIQVGPVVRGTALRDASRFIRFSDFTNQSEYAAAANALNDTALRVVIAPLQIDTLKGRTVSFVAAVGTSPAREDGAIEVVPARLEIVEARGR